MRPLEITLAVLIAVYLVWPLLLRQAKLATTRNWLAPFIPIIVVIHLVTEGYRWQMVLLYLLSAAVLVMAMARILRPGPASAEPRWGRRLAGILVLALAVTVPIPLGNWLPALGILLIALALSERDGILFYVGTFVGTFALALIGAVVGAAGAIAGMFFG